MPSPTTVDNLHIESLVSLNNEILSDIDQGFIRELFTETRNDLASLDEDYRYLPTGKIVLHGLQCHIIPRGLYILASPLALDRYQISFHITVCGSRVQSQDRPSTSNRII